MKNKYDIIDLREQGWSVASIAERTGVPRLRVSDEIYQAIEDGVLEPSTNKSVLEALENRAEVRKLFKKNGVLSIPDIMSATGVSEATAWRHVGALGLLAVALACWRREYISPLLGGTLSLFISCNLVRKLILSCVVALG